MNNKIKVVMGIIVVIILVLIIANIIKNNSNEEIIETEESTTISDIKYDEDTGEYYIEDTQTGEILHTAYSEDELYIYTIDPDYDPKNPDAVTDEEYYEDVEENEN